MHNIFGIIGVINLGTANYLLVASQAEEAAGIQSRQVLEIKEVKFLPFAKFK